MDPASGPGDPGQHPTGELMSIGPAADRLGLRPSALRYYESRELVRPALRRGGRRMYAPEQLRRLAFVQILQRLGISLDTAAAMLDGPSGQWHELARQQISELETLIAQARGAQDFLRHAVECPAEHPVDECPHLIATLDRRVEGTPLDELAAEHLPDADRSAFSGRGRSGSPTPPA